MPFSSRTTIATHVLLAIVTFEGQAKTTSSFLAGSVNVNPVIIRNILGQLKRAGLVQVEAGIGGARLLKAPETITLLDIFNAVEGRDKPLFHFHKNPNPDCPVGRNVHAVLDDKLTAAARAMAASLAATTLADLLTDLNTRLAAQA